MAQHLKNLCNTGDQEILVRSLYQEDPLKEETATHSSILAWKIPGKEELVGYSPESRKESDTTEQVSTHNQKKKNGELAAYAWGLPLVLH